MFKHKTVKIIASWLLIQTTGQLLFPPLSYALTAGPTAPEATSFEPIDTTDMVNLNSGDLTYNIPLLEVPGPEGGYPLSLSYHAGIQPNEEASWVGLGWSLNPGAISRNVNGYADDHQDASQVKRDFWEGGNTSTLSVGVNIGLPASAASVSFGLSFSQDTYKGFGLGSSVGVGIGIAGTPASVGVSMGDDGYGSTFAGAHVSLSKPIGGGAASGLSLGTSVGISTNFQSVSTNAGAGISAHNGDHSYSTSLLGASISSGSSKPSFSVGGGSISINNDKAGRIQTQSSGFGLDVPVLPFVSVSLGYNYVRYWSDEKVSAYTNGALYYPTEYASNSTYYDNHAFDTYRLPDPVTENFLDNPDPDFIQGGSFPDYDNYYVTAQGLSGSIRPYAFQHALVSMTRTQGDGKVSVRSQGIGFNNKQVNFRFENDFSNQYRQSPGNTWTQKNGFAAYPFDSNPSFGNNDGTFGYQASSNRLVGSKHIEWFTNQDIISGIATQKGFVDTSSPGFIRTSANGLSSQIGGFMITNESGVTYHYALPAYSYGEHVYSEAVDHSQGLNYNHVSKPNKYAYTWFLTAITGPDYVDRGVAGVDVSDWGYWVTFAYGKWNDNYKWRNPSEGFHRDIDGRFQSYSTGSKEIYYLNSISTRTHTALFEKALRVDGKGAAEIIGTITPENDINGITQATYTSKSKTYPLNREKHRDTYYPGLQLRLNRVLLFNNSDLLSGVSSIVNKSTIYNLSDISNRFDGVAYNSTIGHKHLGQNVIDKEDIKEQGNAFLSKCIRIISFDHTYNLCPGTINSYGTEQSPYGDTPSPSLAGKLTLNSISFGGVGGANLMPPTRFYYDLPQTVAEQVTVNSVTNGTSANNFYGEINLHSGSLLKPGDVVKLASSNDIVYATILNQYSSQIGSLTYPVCYLHSTPKSIGNYYANVTKNPPYLKDNVDNWGMFESDFNADFTGATETSIAHKTTALSNKNTDVWSLRRILSPLGSTVNIEYAGDEYRKPVLDQPKLLVTTAGGPHSAAEGNAGIGHLYLSPFTYSQALTLFRPNQIIHVTGLTGPAYPLNTGVGIIDPCGKNAYKYFSDVQLEILSIDNIGNSLNNGSLTVKVANNSFAGDLFYTAGSDGMGISTGYIKTANASFDSNYGGGIRVAKVKVESNNYATTTSYDYHNSGITSYEATQYYPISTVAYANYKKVVDGCDAGMQACAKYAYDYIQSMPQLISYAREIVPPGVMYERVTVSESFSNGSAAFSNLGSVAYQFQVFERGMIGIVGSPYQNIYPSNTVEFRTRKMAIKNLTSSLGNLLRIAHYDAQGKLLTETVNHFASDGISPAGNTAFDSQEASGYIAQAAATYEQKLASYNYQGIIKESYGDFRAVRRIDDNYDLKGIISQRESYPNIQTSSTTTDYKLGIKQTTQTLAFDFYSGSPIKSVATDGYGNKFMTVTTPAYRQYPAMGPTASPVANGTSPNRNMLSQVAATYVYKADATNNPVSLLTASAQTWSDGHSVLGADANQPLSSALQTGIWRPLATYAWMPTTSNTTGLSPLTGSSGFSVFPFGAGSPAAFWRKVSEITSYNVYSNALEAMDINGQYVATKLGFTQSKVLVTGGPARYEEIAYSGAEEELVDGAFSGGIKPFWPAGATDAAELYTETTKTGNTHTGHSSVLVHNNRNGFVYQPNVNKLDATKPYRASVWATQPTVTLYAIDDKTSQMVTATGKATWKANGWYLITLDIPPIGTGSLRVGVWNATGQDVYVDDFRFQPTNAQTVAYVYAPSTGRVTDILDNNNLFTHYEYDAVGRLARVQREAFDAATVSNQANAQYSYHYAQQPLPLDDPSLQIEATVSGSSATVTVQLPSLDVSEYSISFRPDAGVSSFVPCLPGTTTFICNYPSASGVHWVTVRLTDKKGKVREQAVKVTIQ